MSPRRNAQLGWELDKVDDPNVKEVEEEMNDTSIEEVEEEINDRREEEEDAVRPKMQRQPEQPTTTEVKEHELTHVPFRSWCAHCVRGRSINDKHQKKDKVEREQEREADATTTVAVDDAYLNTENKETTEEVDKPIVVYVDRKSGTVGWYEVDNKGKGDGKPAKKLAKDIEDMGYLGNQIIVKGDQEPALREMLREAGRMRGAKAETILMCSPVGESQANGAVEGTIRRLAGLLRTIKSCCESKLKMRIERGHPLFNWMLPWTATVINRYVRDNGGQTPYRRQRGREAGKNLCEYGEKVLYYPLKGPGRSKDKTEARWKYGIWLGISNRSDEVIIGTETGVIKARSVRSLVEKDRWDKEFVDKIQGTPQQPIPGRDSDHSPTSAEGKDEEDRGERVTGRDERAGPGDESERKRSQALPPEEVTKTMTRREEEMRQMYVTKRMMEKHGKTKGCPGCDGNYNEAHNKQCRDRMRE